MHLAAHYGTQNWFAKKIERRDAKAQKNNLEKAKGHGAKHSSLCSLLSQKISSALLRLCV
jgi:hypothetical protein